MKFLHTLLLVILLPLIGLSQKYASRYKSQLEPNSTLISSGVNFTIEKLSNGSYLYKTYYTENKQITKIATFKTNRFQIKHGKYQEYYDDGTLVKSGQYVDNKKSGEWIESGWSGQYQKGKKTGKWIKKQLINDSFVTRKIENYQEGNLHGTTIMYDSLGLVSREHVYEQGVLISGTTDGTQEFMVVEQMPRFPGCEDLYSKDKDLKECADKALLQYIYSNVKYPKKAIRQSAQGEALISFVINKDGSVSQIKVLRGITKEIAKECVRLISKMPRWRPGMIDNKPVKVQYNLPVNFRLQ